MSKNESSNQSYVVTLKTFRANTAENIYNNVLKRKDLFVKSKLLTCKFTNYFISEFIVEYSDVKGNWVSDIYRKVNKEIVKLNVYAPLDVKKSKIN